MSTTALVLRNFPGHTSGDIVDTTGWLHTRPLIEDRFLQMLDSDDIAKVADCPCGKKYLPSARLHDCPALRAEREKKAAEAKAKVQQQSAPAPAPTTQAQAPAQKPTQAAKAS